MIYQNRGRVVEPKPSQRDLPAYILVGKVQIENTSVYIAEAYSKKGGTLVANITPERRLSSAADLGTIFSETGVAEDFQLVNMSSRQKKVSPLSLQELSTIRQLIAPGSLEFLGDPEE